MLSLRVPQINSCLAKLIKYAKKHPIDIVYEPNFIMFHSNYHHLEKLIEYYFKLDKIGFPVPTPAKSNHLVKTPTSKEVVDYGY